MPIDLFILKLFDPSTRFFFCAWVLVVVVSITLHELAHGWAALRCGDDTPVRLGRMTGNPLVHMGPFSIAALLIVGIAWGAMPIDPSRLRGKYAEAKVAFAGPSLNLGLAILALVGCAMMERFALDGIDDPMWLDNAWQFLWIAGAGNFVLFVFNMMPAPPLDGSHILANFHRPYANFLADPSKHGVHMLMFFGAWVLIGPLMDRLVVVAFEFKDWVRLLGA